jgi:3-oxoacyl-(acyl-carrier-protein) synthase
VCLKTASGFGGSNAAIVLRRGEGEKDIAATAPGPTIRETAAVTITPDGRAFGEMIRERFKALASPDMKFYKMDDLSKLAYVATSGLLAQTGPLKEKYRPDEIGIILANRVASLDTDTRHCRHIEQNGDEASPAVFVYTLPNVAAGEVSIRHKIQGETTFFIDADADRAEGYARLLLGRGDLKAAICGWCDLMGDDFAANMKLLETE